jgi:hypothetical protein
VVHAETEHARDRLGAEPRPRSKAGVERREPEVARVRAKPDGTDELRVELADRHGPVRVRGDDLGNAEGREHEREVSRCQLLVRAEVGGGRRHEPGVDDRLDLRGGPGAGCCAGRAGGARGSERDDQAAEKNEAAHRLEYRLQGTCSTVLVKEVRRRSSLQFSA